LNHVVAWSSFVAFARRKADIGVKAPFPEFVEPALASSIEKVPSGSRWIHEIKFDGYRVQVHLHNETVRVFTRRGHDWTKRFKKVGALIELGPTAMIELQQNATGSNRFGGRSWRRSPPAMIA
jgi:ATP-dependent DNA ligase